ncbi:MAG: hypothetical protein WC022_00780 [Parcubacteria group bacterium]
MKALIFFGMIVGSYAGSFVPLLWGESVFSMVSILFGGIGGFFGIWLGYRAAGMIGVE